MEIINLAQMTKQKKDVSIQIRVTKAEREFIRQHFGNFSQEVREIIARKMKAKDKEKTN